MKLKAPSTCPVCGGEYETTLLTCKKCKSELGGHFSGCEFCQLNDDETHFLRTFVKCRGSIKEVEKELGISYPTVRSRLDGVIKRLGLVDTAAQEQIKQDRKDIFDRLNRGDISVDEAAQLLKNS